MEETMRTLTLTLAAAACFGLAAPAAAETMAARQSGPHVVPADAIVNAQYASSGKKKVVKKKSMTKRSSWGG
jgi:hypothetical protein